MRLDPGFRNIVRSANDLFAFIPTKLTLQFSVIKFNYIKNEYTKKTHNIYQNKIFFKKCNEVNVPISF